MTSATSVFPSWFVRFSSLRGVCLFYLLYGLFNAGIARSVGPTLALDDVKLNVVTQSFEWGYLPGNPPLYEWLLILAQQGLGPTLAAALTVKYALLTAAGGFAYFLGKELFGHKSWAATGALSLLLLYQIGWNAHQAFTHTLTLIPVTLAFWWALLRVMRRGTTADFILLGVVVGVGLISKYSFFAVLTAGALSAIIISDLRRAVLKPGLALSFGIALAVASPHLMWLFAENSDVSRVTAERLQGDAAPYWARLFSGLPAAMWAMAVFFLPFAVILLVIYRTPLFRNRDRLSDALRVMQCATLAGAGLIIGGVVLLGIPSLQERYVIAFLLPGFFLLLGLIQRVEVNPRNNERYLIVLFVFVTAFTGARVVQAAIPGKPFCTDCRQWIPYEAVAEGLEASGYKSDTLVGFTDHTAGNLRRLFPKARVLSAHQPFYTPPKADGEQGCFFVWSNDLGPGIPDALEKRLDPYTIETVTGRWRHPLREEGWRQTTWSIARVDRDQDLLRVLCRVTG